jgi:hypothetical protein
LLIPALSPLAGKRNASSGKRGGSAAHAAESTGLHYYDEVPAGQEPAGDQGREFLIAGIDELTPGDRRHVAALAGSLRNRAPARAARPVNAAGIPAGPGRPARGPGRAGSVRPRPAVAGTFYPAGQLAGTPSWSASSS